MRNPPKHLFIRKRLRLHVFKWPETTDEYIKIARYTDVTNIIWATIYKATKQNCYDINASLVALLFECNHLRTNTCDPLCWEVTNMYNLRTGNSTLDIHCKLSFELVDKIRRYFHGRNVCMLTFYCTPSTKHALKLIRGLDICRRCFGLVIAAKDGNNLDSFIEMINVLPMLSRISFNNACSLSVVELVRFFNTPAFKSLKVVLEMTETPNVVAAIIETLQFTKVSHVTLMSHVPKDDMNKLSSIVKYCPYLEDITSSGLGVPDKEYLLPRKEYNLLLHFTTFKIFKMPAELERMVGSMFLKERE